jgi:hypothetical protein
MYITIVCINFCLISKKGSTVKKMECKKCGREITLGIDDEERSFTCCGQPMIELTETSFCKNANSEVSAEALAKAMEGYF